MRGSDFLQICDASLLPLFRRLFLLRWLRSFIVPGKSVLINMILPAPPLINDPPGSSLSPPGDITDGSVQSRRDH